MLRKINKSGKELPSSEVLPQESRCLTETPSSFSSSYSFAQYLKKSLVLVHQDFSCSQV